jgi:hypothetical protein
MLFFVRASRLTQSWGALRAEQKCMLSAVHVSCLALHPDCLADEYVLACAQFLSVYVTMYLNDHQRSAFYESLGLNTTQFNRLILSLPAMVHSSGCCHAQHSSDLCQSGAHRASNAALLCIYLLCCGAAAI